MAFVSATEIAKRSNRGGTRRTRIQEDLVMATDSQRSKNNPGYALRIGMTQALAERARFLPGDRVDLLIDAEERRCMIRRVDTGGWKLTSPNPGSAGGRLLLKMKHREGLPTTPVAAACRDVVVSPEGIEFTVPDSARFTGNARLEDERTEAPAAGWSGSFPETVPSI